ncbi:unnamed protein product [Lota lota]
MRRCLLLWTWSSYDSHEPISRVQYRIRAICRTAAQVNYLHADASDAVVNYPNSVVERSPDRREPRGLTFTSGV